MEFEEWEPFYRRIVDEFGFSVADDERSARVLSELCLNKDICSPACLKRRVGEEVTVVGHAPGLEDELRKHEVRGTVLAADGATSTLMSELGRVPDVLVTDLDGDVPAQIAANAQGAVAVILAHGDNEASIRKFVPWFPGLITPTTQARPFPGVYNFGGFTDGDRAVMIARQMGAKRINLLGFDFLHPREKGGKDPSVKARKLRWAERLIFTENPPGVEIVRR